MEKPSGEFVSPTELAKRLGISRRTVFRLVSTGQLPQPIRLTKRTVRWEWTAVQEFLASNGHRRMRRGGDNGK
ncbi:MAG: helix-turn-helix transcriptional regulator [Anaerolineae bacterium]